MNKQEVKEVNMNLYNVYAGIIKNNMRFSNNKQYEIQYDFFCEEYQELKKKYNLEKIAKDGSDFERALRLLHHFAPRLQHDSNYANHITCNALELLNYCYEKDDVGINCLNKSKVLAECCMAIGIKARRVGIMPYSVYDTDTHVVTEIYDRKLCKWIMLDCTTNGYFVNEMGIPLSCLEIREHIGNYKVCSIVYPRQSIKDIKKLFEKNIEDNVYYAKNFFFLRTDECATFGEKGSVLYFSPEYFDIRQWHIDLMWYLKEHIARTEEEKLFYSNRITALATEKIIVASTESLA